MGNRGEFTVEMKDFERNGVTGAALLWTFTKARTRVDLIRWISFIVISTRAMEHWKLIQQRLRGSTSNVRARFQNVKLGSWITAVYQNISKPYEVHNQLQKTIARNSQRN